MKVTLTKAEFELLYDGIAGGPRGFIGGELRIIGAALDKLEAKAVQVAGNTYRLASQEESFIFTNVEAKLIREALDSVHWTGRVARQVSGILDKLLSSPDLVEEAG